MNPPYLSNTLLEMGDVVEDGNAQEVSVRLTSTRSSFLLSSKRRQRRMTPNALAIEGYSAKGSRKAVTRTSVPLFKSQELRLKKHPSRHMNRMAHCKKIGTGWAHVWCSCGSDWPVRVSRSVRVCVSPAIAPTCSVYESTPTSLQVIGVQP